MVGETTEMIPASANCQELVAQAEALQAEVADLRGKVVQLRRVIDMMQARQFAVASAVREMTAVQAPPVESWECDDVI